MDMDSSRRSFDRSRELGAKKPRLAADSDRTTPNGRAFLQASSAAPATGSISSRLRAAVSATERDSDDSSGGGAYHPQHPHQELLSQYKTALSELTFNSKPIITNLTIIAGENQHVAKGIAATICSNILEVPSDQKLPSLYLLDSIVKNIGRDYIKYFAARLPEVFCKAYKQVDPSTHPGMRHLFGTWKGVFPLQSLQVIEKELGFGQAVNGSSSAAVISRPDSQSQRPAHSIHVNPKYLERQRLQQSSRAKGVTNDSTETMADGIGDVERLEGTTGISAARPWSNLPLKLHNVHRSQPEIETVSEKNSTTAYGDYKGGSDLSRASGLAMGRVSERTMELARDKSRYMTGIGVTESISSQRNGLDIKHKLSGYTASRSANAGVRLKTAESTENRSNGVLSTDWKNSEEEEYMWDDMNLRLKNHSASGGLRKESWIPDDSEKLDLGNHLRKQRRVNNVGPKHEIDASIDSLSSEEKEYAIPGKKISSPWSMDEPYLVDGVGLSKSSSSSSPGPLEGSNLVEFSKTAHSLAKTGPLSLVGPSQSRGSSFGLGANAPTGTIGQQWASSRECSRLPPMHQLPALPSYSGGFLEGNYTLGEREQSVPHTDFNAVKFPGSLNTRVQNQINEESVNLPLHCIQPHNFPKLHGQNLQVSSATAHAIQSRHQKMQLDATLPEPSLTNQKLVVPQTSSIRGRPLAGNSSENSNVIPPDFPGNPNRSSLLEAVMKSGILSSTSVTPVQPKHNLKDPRKNSQLAVQPPLLTGPLPTKLTSSRTKVSSTPSSLHLLDKASTSANPSQRKVERPRLPAGPAPPSSAAGSAPVSSVGNKTVDPISNLLSSLVAKGLISASKPKSAVISSPKKSVKPHSPSSGARTSTSMPVSTVTQATATLSSSVRDEASSLESQAKDSVAEPEPVTSEVESLIGFEFKSDVIREAHPLVVSSLFDELLHQCSICGLRLKLKERLDRHLEWHSSKIPESDSLCGGSRKWFLHSGAWIAGGRDSGNESSVLADVSEKAIDKDVQMVIADESQCICVLCGQLFEDFYCQERDQWMFKDAVYMTVPSGYSDSGAMKDTAGDGPIVHANCISESSACDLGLANEIKMEEEE